MKEKAIEWFKNTGATVFRITDPLMKYTYIKHVCDSPEQALEAFTQSLTLLTPGRYKIIAQTNPKASALNQGGM